MKFYSCLKVDKSKKIDVETITEVKNNTKNYIIYLNFFLLLIIISKNLYTIKEPVPAPN